MALVFASGGQGGGSGTVQSVTAADTSIVVAGTAANPTVATGTLDKIAADHAPISDWSNNSHKITDLAAGVAASDAATVGQIPASGYLASGVQGTTISTTSTTYAGGTDMLTTPLSFTADGTSSYVIRVFVPAVNLNTILRTNFDNAEGNILAFAAGNPSVDAPAAAQNVVIPAAGTHTVNVRVYAANSGTAHAYASPDLGTSNMLVTVEAL